MRKLLLFPAVGLACSLLAAPASATQPASAGFVVKVPTGATVAAVHPQLSAQKLLVRYAAIPSNVALAPKRTFTLSIATVYRFSQVHMGVPVLDRGAGIAVDGQGNVILATSRIEPNLPSSVTPAISAADAASIVTQRTGVPASAADARLYIVPMPGGARLAWIVQAPPLLPQLYSPLVTIDANTGRVFGSVNAVRFENQAQVYTTNPVVDNGVTTTVTLPIVASDTTPQNADLVSYNCVDNGTVRTITTKHGTRSVHICDLLQATPDSSGDYTQYNPAPDDQGGDYFSELQIFYHANKAFDYFRSFTGNGSFQLASADRPLFEVANWMAAPRTPPTPGDAGTEAGAGDAGADAEAGADAGLPALAPYQNAAYVPFTGSSSFGLPGLYPNQITGGVLQFGQGAAADYAYDGEVIYHEFTHAVVNATLKLSPYWHLDDQGGSDSPGAMNEGLADFFSASISGKAKLGTYAVKDMQSPNLKLTCIRDLDNSRLCPTDMVGEVHTDSEFFSGAMWKVRSALASDAEKKLFRQTVFTVMTTITSGDIGYDEFANALVTALANTMGQSTANAMQAEFHSRGLLPHTNRTIKWIGTPLSGTDPVLADLLVLPGLMDFNAALSYAPSFYQIEVPLAVGTTSLTVTFNGHSGTTGGFGGSSGIAPAYLVSYGSPITFDPNNGYAASTQTLIDAVAPSMSVPDGGADAGATGDAGQIWTAQIPIPAGTDTAYLMLVNQTRRGAYYDNLSIAAAVVQGVDAGAPDDAATPQPDAGEAGTGDAGTKKKAAPHNDSGCGCHLHAPPSGSGAAWMLLGIAGWFGWRRRARSRQREA